MSSATVASATVIFSEVILSAYPILIKAATAGLESQLIARMGVFTVAAAVIVSMLSGLNAITQNLTAVSTYTTGALNILHVGSSYLGFKLLPAGDAMALFYTNPVWNVLAASAILGEPLPSIETAAWMLLALIGSLLVCAPSFTFGINRTSIIGILAALTAAITESCIFIWFKLHDESDKGNGKEEQTKGNNVINTSMQRMKQMYFGSFVLLILLLTFMGYFKSSQNVQKTSWTPLILFNLFIGFVGYALHFIAIPQLPTAIFSTLTFFGLVAAYGFGYLFLDEKARAASIIGSICIIIANWRLLAINKAARGD